MGNFPESNDSTLSEREISLVDVIVFIKKSWKIILSFILVGVLGAAIFLLSISKQYEASAEVKMAEILTSGALIPIFKAIEEPQNLIARMNYQIDHDTEIKTACGFANKSTADDTATKIKLLLSKYGSNLVKLQVVASTEELARSCINQLFQSIRNSQSITLAQYIQYAGKQLSEAENRLASIFNISKQINLGGKAVSAIELIKLNEVSLLQVKVIDLQNFIYFSKDSSSSLYGPPVIKEKEVFSMPIVLLAVFFSSGFIGILFCLVRQLIRANRKVQIDC